MSLPVALTDLTVESIFTAALAIESPDERAAYLDQACAGRPELRRRVETLLAAQPQLGRFLDLDAAEANRLPAEPLLEQPGMWIGPYRLMEQIGEGGMGLVFVAEQETPLKRKVALKVVRPGMDTRDVIARFEAERQALAMMDHPHIAKVLDAGTTPSGRPYFVMELVRGVPITGFCDQKRLTVRQRLTLFVDVCLAIQHAHQKGIIHRDIKPSNVLVTLHDGKPVAKVIDFGVAKAICQRLTERTIYTRFTQLIGTPLYMSPEQAEMSGLDVDTRSDIYSLGVLLYELLAGVTPFDQARLGQAAFDEIRRIIREEEPPKPSTRVSTLDAKAQITVADCRGAHPQHLDRQLRGELDWIVMKALEKDRTRRYETAGALAADVGRYLSGEPVTACPPSRSYQLRKLLQRHRPAAFALSLVAVSLVASTVVSIWQAVAANHARTLADERLESELQARREAERQRVRADHHLATANGAVEEYLTTVSENRLLDLPGMEPLRKELLQSALEYYRLLLRDESREPTARARLAAARIRVGSIQMSTDEFEAAVLSFEGAFGVVEELLHGQQISVEGLRQLAGIHSGERSSFHSTRPPPDLPRMRRAIEWGIRIWGELLRRDPGCSGFRSDLAVLRGAVAELEAAMDERPKAARSLEQAREQWRKLVLEHPDVATYQAGLASCCDRLGLVLKSVGEEADAVEAYEEALEVAESLTCGLPEVPHHRRLLAQSQSSLGKILIHSDPARAQALLREALANYRQLSRSFPMVPAFREETSIAAFNLAVHLSENGEPAAAESLREATHLLGRIAEDYPQQSDIWRRLARYHYALGLIEHRLGQAAQARQAFAEALSIRNRLVSEFPSVSRYAEELAWQLSTCPDLALRDAARAVALSHRCTESSPRNADCWKTLGVAQYRLADYQQAVVSLNKALSLEPLNTAAQWFLAMSCARLGRRAEAEMEYKKADAWTRRSRPNNLELGQFRAEAEELICAGDR